jgi:2-dehydropantoate 2-reductase
MLQDLERERPMEIDPLLTVVQEMGRMVGVPTPTIDVVLALVKQRGEIAGLYTRPKLHESAEKSAVAAQ